jgi:hypothetical protein
MSDPPEPKRNPAERFFEFFTANIRNKTMHRAWFKAACRFAEWCEGRGLHDLASARPATRRANGPVAPTGPVTINLCASFSSAAKRAYARPV